MATRSPEVKEADRELVRRIVNQRFGGPTNLARLLKKRYPDEAVTTKAVNMWIWRGSIPGQWFLRLQEIAAKQGRQLLGRDDWKNRPTPAARKDTAGADDEAGSDEAGSDESWMD